MSDETAAVAEGDAEAQVDETASGSETEVEFPSFDVEIPAELAALLDEDDGPEDVSEEEIDALAEENEDVPREVLARMRAAEKRAEYLERLRVQDAKKSWAEEAAKYFPHSKPMLGEINATSKRGFLRTAREIHESYKGYIEGDVLGRAKAAQSAAKEEAVAEGKEEAKKAWGQAVDQPAPSEATVTLQTETRRRRNADLGDTVKAMLFPKG